MDINGVQYSIATVRNMSDEELADLAENSTDDLCRVLAKRILNPIVDCTSDPETRAQ